MQATAAKRNPGLQRVLGPVDATALVVSNVIGVGIFTTPGIVAQMVPRPGLMLAVWLAGGLLAFAGARAYAELATLRPYAGGEYVYLHDAFGPLAGFLTGWTSFIAGFSGAIAAGAIGLASYLGRFFPAAADARPLVTIPLLLTQVTISPRAVVALAVVFGLAAIHVRGLGPGRVVQNLLAGLNVCALLLLVAWGFSSRSGSVTHFAEPAGAAGYGSWLLALIPVMFTYSGWNAAAYVAEEVREPGRNLLRALASGTAIVVVLYFALNLLYLFALSPQQLAGAINAGDAAAAALFGPAGAAVVSAIVVVALAGGISAMIIAGPRVYFAMARDGVFPAAAAQVHPRTRTPAAAIAAQVAWSAVLVLTGGFEQLLIYTGFAVVLFSGLAVLALFVLRRRGAGAATGSAGRIGPALFVLASLAMVAAAVIEKPGPALAGVALIGAGIPLYWWWRRKPKAAPPT